MITSLEPTQQGTSDARNLGLNASSPMVDNFLRLLLTQLQHQDPMNPMEAREFTSQLAQLSMVEQAIQTNEALKTLNLYQESANNTRALNLIGKEVRASGDQISTGDGGSSEVRFRLDEPVATTDVFLYDPVGRLIRSIPLGPKGAGEHSWTWDGKDQTGQFVPPGTYRVEIVTTDVRGDSFKQDLMVQGTVEAVQFAGGEAVLLVSGVPLSMGDILEVRE